MEYQSLEHLYVYGPVGSGKTKASLSIADALRDHRFHYIQADRSVGKIFNSFPHLDHVQIWDAFTHEQIQKTVDRLTLLLEADKHPEKTWVIVDTIGRLYNDVQDTYSYKKWGISADDHREMLTTGGKIKGTIDGFMGEDWAVISRIFLNDIMYPLCRFYGNNYFLIAHQRPTEVVRGNNKFKPQMQPELQSIYEEIGYIPQSHYKVDTWVDSVLWFNNLADPFTMMTVKDTERKYLRTPTPFGHFWRDYNILTSLNGHVR